MTTGRINQVAIVQDATSPPRPKARTSDASQHNGQWLVLNHTAVAELFPTLTALQSNTSVNSCRHPWRRSKIHGHRALSFRPKRRPKNAPPSFDSFVNLPPRQHPSIKDCQALPGTPDKTQRFPTRAPLV